MRALALPAGVVLLALLGCGRPPQMRVPLEGARAEKGSHHRWTFDPAAGFVPSAPAPIAVTESHTTLLAVLGRWRSEKDASAPSAPYVFTQGKAYASTEAPRAIVTGLTFGAMNATVKCRVVATSSEQTCGVLFHAQSVDRFVVARLDARDHVVRLSTFEGVEQELVAKDASVVPGEWHTLSVYTRGLRVRIDLDGKEVIDQDLPDRFDANGHIGLFTKGDSTASFDDLQVDAF